MRETRRSSRRRALIETENRPCRKKKINENNDNIKQVSVNGCKISISDNNTSSNRSSDNTSSENNNTSRTSNISDRNNRSSRRLTKMVAVMAAATFSTLVVLAHYSFLVQGGIQTVGNMDGTTQDTTDQEAVAAAFARKYAEGIMDSVAPGNIRSPEAAGGKQTGTARNTQKTNPETDRENGLKNASIEKKTQIPTIREAKKYKKEKQDNKGVNEPGKKKAKNVKEKSNTSELRSKEKKLDAGDLKTVGVSMEKSPQELRREEEEGTSLSETWSEDGRVHCVEESPDTIRCHTHDDLEEDKSFKEMSEETKSKSVNNYRTPTNPRITGSPNRLTGGNITGSRSTENSPWEGFSRENQPDGLLLPTDKISDRKRSLVRLDLTENEPKIINVYTGEIKPLKMLNETEDVEIDSLVSTYKPRGKTSNYATHGTDQSLQELLTELRDWNFQELDIDYEEKLVYRIWQNDEHCRRFATRFGRGVPEVDLVAYPRSGSSWLRYLLESATGVFTGTAVASNGLHQLGFLGEAEPPYTRRTLTSLTHSASANPGVERQAVQGGRDNVPAILLIRNPSDSIASHWKARNTSGLDAVSGTSPIDTFQTPEFHDFVKEELEKWEQTYSNRLLWSRSVHVLHYEDLSRRPLLELMKVLRFLQLPPPSGGRLFCLRKHIEGRLKGRRRKYDPYTTQEEDAVWSSVTRVTALLQLRGLDLPAYHTPLAEYPPDRMYKSFIKRHLEKNDSHKRQKDEL